jgi:hypothetical protein
MSRLLAGFSGATAALLAGQMLAAQFTYVNERFGTAATFPNEVFSDRMGPPANGDGLTFLSADGASVAVFGMNNALAQTPQGLVDEAKARDDEGYELTYSSAGKDWAVLSGYEEGQIFYERFEFGGDDVIHGLLMKYPPALKAKYDPLVDPIAASLHGP